MKPRYKNAKHNNIMVIRQGKPGVIDTLIMKSTHLGNAVRKCQSDALKAIAQGKYLFAGELLKEIGRIDNILLEYSKSILPYIKPRLETIDVEEKQTKRYVIRMPSKPYDGNKQREIAAQKVIEAKATPIDHDDIDTETRH